MNIVKFAFLPLLFFIVSCCFPGSNSTPALQTALDALDNDSMVVVSKTEGSQPDCDYYYTFRPVSDNQTKAFIFYPGGAVKPEAYAPLLKEIAAEGYLVILLKVSMDLAITDIFGTPRADVVINSGNYPEIEKWAVGGHSLGGVVAAMYAADNLDKVDGLVFWASYPASSIRDIDLDVISIYGTLDGLTDDADITGSEENLPEDTQWVPIVGGNHTQFGYYGDTEAFLQEGDNAAEIDRDNQTEQIVNATSDFLEKL